MATVTGAFEMSLVKQGGKYLKNILTGLGMLVCFFFPLVGFWKLITVFPYWVLGGVILLFIYVLRVILNDAHTTR